MITKNKAQSFYDELKKKVYPPDGVWTLGQIKMSPKLISEYMGVSEKEAQEYCDVIVNYGLSEWEGSLMVV